MRRCHFLLYLLVVSTLLSFLSGCALAPGRRLNRSDMGKTEAAAL